MQFDDREITAIEEEFKKRFKTGSFSINRNIERGEIIFTFKNREKYFLWTVNEQELSFAGGSEEVVDIIFRKMGDTSKMQSKADFVMKRLLENT